MQVGTWYLLKMKIYFATEFQRMANNLTNDLNRAHLSLIWTITNP